MLEGQNINLRICEKDDLPLIAKWINNPEFLGEYFSPHQWSFLDNEKAQGNDPFEFTRFIIEKKDGSKIGVAVHFYMINPYCKTMEIGYVMNPSERGKGYTTEATTILVDYLFLTRDLSCIQAFIDIRNIASQKVVEKIGFTKEGEIRKRFFIRGDWRNSYLYSILKEEWKKPRTDI
ncbi:MAG: GNAT family N-acetyltransferase [Promethearchaeota archaeon]